MIKKIAKLWPPLLGAVTGWVCAEYGFNPFRAILIIVVVFIIQSAISGFIRAALAVKKYKQAEKALTADQLERASRLPLPDKMTVNSAMWKLIEGVSPDLSEAETVIAFALRIKPSSGRCTEEVSRRRDNNRFTGFTKEAGNVTVGKDEESYESTVSPNWHRERVGEFIVWRGLGNLAFTHYWKSSLTSLRSDFQMPPRYELFFSHDFAPTSFYRIDHETRISRRLGGLVMEVDATATCLWQAISSNEEESDDSPVV